MELESHREIQELLINKVFRFLSYVIFPILLINLSRYFILGWLISFNYYIVASLVIFVISWNSKKIPYKYKIIFLIFFFLGIAIAQGLNFGMVGFMTELLILSIFLGVIFLKKKAAFIVHALCFVLLTSCALLSIKGVIPMIPDFEEHINSVPSWSSYLVTFLFMTSVIIVIAGEIGNLLASKIKALEDKNAQLMMANEEVRQLQGILPICCSCKKIRDDEGYWNQIESYIEKRSKALFSHSMCPDCLEKQYGDELWYIQSKKNRETQ